MEIHNTKSVGDSAKPGSPEASREAVRQTFERLDRAQEARRLAFEEHDAETRRHDKSDRVELSDRGRLFIDDPGGDEDRATREARDRRIAELREAVRDGTLFTPERTEEAAKRLLGG